MTLDQLSNLIKDPKLFGILIVRPFGLLLQWLYSIVQNYGIAVILFALLVKLVCIPLTIKSKNFTGEDPENPNFSYPIPVNITFGLNIGF